MVEGVGGEDPGVHLVQGPLRPVLLLREVTPVAVRVPVLLLPLAAPELAVQLAALGAAQGQLGVVLVLVVHSVVAVVAVILVPLLVVAPLRVSLDPGVPLLLQLAEQLEGGGEEHAVGGLHLGGCAAGGEHDQGREAQDAELLVLLPLEVLALAAVLAPALEGDVPGAEQGAQRPAPDGRLQRQLGVVEQRVGPDQEEDVPEEGLHPWAGALQPGGHQPQHVLHQPVHPAAAVLQHDHQQLGGAHAVVVLQLLVAQHGGAQAQDSLRVGQPPLVGARQEALRVPADQVVQRGEGVPEVVGAEGGDVVHQAGEEAPGPVGDGGGVVRQVGQDFQDLLIHVQPLLCEHALAQRLQQRLQLWVQAGGLAGDGVQHRRDGAQAAQAGERAGAALVVVVILAVPTSGGALAEGAPELVD